MTQLIIFLFKPCLFLWPYNFSSSSSSTNAHQRMIMTLQCIIIQEGGGGVNECVILLACDTSARRRIKATHRKKLRVAWYWNLRFFISKYLQEHYIRCITRAALFLKNVPGTFSTRRIKWSSCDSNFRGQPSGWNRLLVVMCTSTRVLPYKTAKLIQLAIPQYPLLYIPLF